MHRNRFSRHQRPCLCAALATALLATAGCLTPGDALTTRERAIATAAGPLLALDPDANWTACFNELVDHGDDALAYLVRRPPMQRRAAPDDLPTFLHTSLIALLADPQTAPRLSAGCYETTLAVLHFDPRVQGRRIGTVCLPVRELPAAWTELYIGDFDHAAATEVDVEADRTALLAWWRSRQAAGAGTAGGQRLRPVADRLWPVLGRRYADRWCYQPPPGAVGCSALQERAFLLDMPTWDYNLVRAACVQLGSASDPAVQARLIDLVGSPSATLAYNARFALGFSPDDRVRELLKRYKAAVPADDDRKGQRARVQNEQRLHARAG